MKEVAQYTINFIILSTIFLTLLYLLEVNNWLIFDFGLIYLSGVANFEVLRSTKKYKELKKYKEEPDYSEETFLKSLSQLREQEYSIEGR